MNTRTMLTTAAVIAFLFGFGLLLMPAFMTTLYGLGTSPSELLLARLFGGSLLMIGLINWLEKDASYAAVRPLILGNLVGDAIGLLVTATASLGDVMNGLGWLSVAIYLVLTLGFAYLQFMGQPTSITQRA